MRFNLMPKHPHPNKRLTTHADMGKSSEKHTQTRANNSGTPPHGFGTRPNNFQTRWD